MKTQTIIIILALAAVAAGAYFFFLKKDKPAAAGTPPKLNDSTGGTGVVGPSSTIGLGGALPPPNTTNPETYSAPVTPKNPTITAQDFNSPPVHLTIAPAGVNLGASQPAGSTLVAGQIDPKLINQTLTI